MLVKCQRPPACQVLALCPKDVRRHTHPDRMVAPQVNQPKVRRGRDLRITPLGQLNLVYRKIVDKSFAPAPEHRFEEAHLQRVAEAENAKAICIDTAPRIAETAR
jgi:hypothetical protein